MACKQNIHLGASARTNSTEIFKVLRLNNFTDSNFKAKNQLQTQDGAASKST